MVNTALGRNFGGDGHGFSLNSSATARVTHTVTADPQKGTANYTGRGSVCTTSNLSTHPYMYPKADVPDGYLEGFKVEIIPFHLQQVTMELILWHFTNTGYRCRCNA